MIGCIGCRWRFCEVDFDGVGVWEDFFVIYIGFCVNGVFYFFKVDKFVVFMCKDVSG